MLTPRSWWQRLKQGLSKSSSRLTDGIQRIFGGRRIDAATLDDLEDVLIEADMGVETAAAIAAALKRERLEGEVTPLAAKMLLAREIAARLEPVARPLVLDPALKPHVVLMVGVNGTGKTTTIGKLAAQLRSQKRHVVIAAGDTFRAAAVEQLKVWGERTGAEVIALPPGGDPAALAHEAYTKARAQSADVLLIDTAGRLQNKSGLMAELEKIVRVLKKIDPSVPHSVLLTLDATTGQNALSQVELFTKAAGVTGLVMTKLDGTARGGILVALAARFALPVHFIGVGEQIEDLEPFEAQAFARALVGLDEAEG
ncbi:MAG: signal recognition particle-docking protein FtsY [Hyphomicrobiales bacterium]|nr:signal recognition particle-docking protein FtsY [Hyphomicrobiales bacterium]OQW81192.1 MAG: signal recognition particle-docking protein FtsY [Proteobacteria bacterium ST_bin15]